MVAEKDSIIVAIELGTSRISGIAGKKKDGTMQVLAYAEEPTTAMCIKRGIVYNIEKTTQSIKQVIAKLKGHLKLNISQVYVGIGGQSVRSINNEKHRNMLTQTCITADHIDSMRQESYNIPNADYELIENFPQGYIIDGNATDEPVGVMGTNIQGKYLNVVARRQLKTNIENCFNGTEVHIADMSLSAYELAKNVLNETEKRGGSVLVDLGAGTTTVVIYKNNLLRYLVTLPIGSQNITKDLTSFDIDFEEAEKVKKTYGNAFVEGAENGANEILTQSYTTSNGKNVKLTLIQDAIEARLTEIIRNVDKQIYSSGCTKEQLLGGVVLTGGGATMKNIEKAFSKELKMDKVRVANSTGQTVIKNSNVTSLNLEGCTSNTIISLLFAGEENCVGDPFKGNEDLFEKNEREKEIADRKAAEENKKKAEDDALVKLEKYKNNMREGVDKLNKRAERLKEDLKDRRMRELAESEYIEARELLGTDYDYSVATLQANDKFKQVVREAKELSEKYEEALQGLKNAIGDSKKATSISSKIGGFFRDIISED